MSSRSSIPGPASAGTAVQLSAAQLSAVRLSAQTARSARMGDPPSPSPGEDVWRQLVARRVPVQATDPTGAALLERYAPLLAGGPRLVLAQLGQSLDGFIAARTGDAVFITGEQDREHLHRLRALVDAVIVGVSTVVTDDCRLTVRAVEGPSPVRVLLDPTARAPRTAAMLTDGPAPVLWCVASRTRPPDPPAPHVEVLRLPLTGGRFAPSEVLEGLAARGCPRVLVEGGGRTVSEFLAAGVLDRIFVTVAPLLVGDGVPGLRFPGTARLSDALRAPSRRFVLGEDVCFELDLVEGRQLRAAGEPVTESDPAPPVVPDGVLPDDVRPAAFGPNAEAGVDPAGTVQVEQHDHGAGHG
jgi:riboflavin-specific deaminase-like protein